MRIFGFEFKRAKAKALQSVDSGRGWFSWFSSRPETAFQRDEDWTTDTVLAHHAVYACETLIANDVGKLRHKLVEQDNDGIWSEIKNPAFSPVLRRPNHFQNHIQFKQWWITSKLTQGNTYALKQRDGRGIVTALYLLDPTRTRPLVAPDGAIFYELREDNLSGLQTPMVVVPASEIIHDRMNCLFHPLVGVSPIFAAGVAANIGLSIQTNSSKFFGNDSNPGGILMVPGSIPQEKATELKEAWNTNYTGDNTGKIAILADGMKFQPMRMSSVDSQMIEQLKWTAEVVCSTFHVPPYKIGVGALPSYQNIEALQQDYYSACLQSLIEEYEACMDEGLGLETPVGGRQMGVELDLDGLLRMDTATQMKVLAEGVKGSVLMIDEARAKLDRKRVKGGDSIWMQQQNYSLEALQKRDASADPFGTEKPEPAAPPPPAANDDDSAEKFAHALKTKFLEAAANG
jgi:HK97 family phage portal protein